MTLDDLSRLESEPAGAGSTQTGVCPNCGYAPVIALPPPELPDLDRVAERLMFMLRIYPNYRVDSRGPIGLIHNCLREVHPRAQQDLSDGVDPHDVYDRYWPKEDNSPGTTPAAQTDPGVGAHDASAQTKDSTPDSAAVSGVSVPGSDATDDGRCSRVAPSGGDSVPQTSSPVGSTGAAGEGPALLTELPDRTGKPLPDPLDQPVTVRELVEALRSTAGVNAASWEVAFQEMADRLEAGRKG